MAAALIERAQVLMQQNRFKEAGTILRGLLQQEPDNVVVLALLSQVKLEQNNIPEAEQLINNAIGLRPDHDYLYYVKAIIARHADKWEEAETSIQHAVDLNPQGADYFALWASVKLVKKQYKDALELADEALSLDPENILALNIRSTALLKLNRKEDSFSTIEGALAHDPTNAATHTNYGWGLLEKGDPKKALEHFKEALKTNPDLREAREGMAEALKARYLFYRLFLRYAFFMSNLTSKYQWGVILGFYLISRLLNGLARTNPAWQPVLMPIIVLFALIAFSTWVFTPVSNLFLLLNPYGKYLLDRESRISSNAVGISLLICVTGLISYIVFSAPAWLVVAGFGFAMMVPLGSLFAIPKHKTVLIVYTAAMALLGALGIYATFSTGEPFNLFTTLFLFGFIAYQWLANILRSRQGSFY